MTLSYPEPSFKVIVYSLKVNISQTVHSIHSIFGSSPWVFGVGGSSGAISGSIKSKMVSDGHLEYINWP